MAIINGRCYDWNSVTLGISGCENVEPTEISYDAERDEEVIYGKGGDPRGYGTGNRKNSVKMSMLEKILMRSATVMQKKGVKSFFNYIFEKITVSYGNDGQKVVTDTLTNVKFSKFSGKASQGDKSIKVDLEGFAFGGVNINGMKM
ncbi:MAG: hypothetical protein ACLSHV_04020 [Hominisplanchenecus sp.]